MIMSFTSGRTIVCVSFTDSASWQMTMKDVRRNERIGLLRGWRVTVGFGIREALISVETG